VNRIALLLDQFRNDTIGQCFRRYLHPVLSHLTKKVSDKSLGRWYIALSRLIFELYIPNIPIDPAAMQSVALKLSRDAQNTLHSQLTLHMNIEQADTGDRRNTVVDYLTGALQSVEKEISQLPESVFLQRPDISALHAYWREVYRFGNEVLSPSKIGPLLLGLESNESVSALREEVVQESISGFCHRLNTTYSNYRDINIALQIALLSTRLGLRLVAEMSATKDDGAYFLATAAVAFPSVQSATMLLLETPATSSCIPPISHVLLKLASIGFESLVGIDVEFRWKQLATLYDQAHRLWLIDRARKAGNAEASQSLYRHKHTTSNFASDAEIEQQEFLELFPDFEDALDQSSRDLMYNDNLPSYHVDSNQMQQLVSMFLLIEDTKENSSETKLQVSAVYKDMRRTALRSVLSSQMASLPETLDLDSRVFQFSMLHSQLAESQMTATHAKRNFYADSNVPQAKKAARAIEALTVRLEALIHDWPDQMVLHQLKDRCDLILQLDLHSPVAKLLSVLEQLLLKIDDWEMYASRENTLKMHKDVLAGLIVEWRRLELSCWNELLRFEAKSFADSASEWWFRLYDVIVRGTLDASAREHNDTSDTIASYLDNVIPLLDDFICTSPLGQFHTRLAFLRGFENHSHKLSLSQENAPKVALQRVLRVLHATIQYYDLFSISLTNHLSKEKELLEKEIHAFIKLASWKDINVLALKQSAQRTHHRLFKIIRKFREVLRQPVTNRLQAEPAGNLERVVEVPDLHTISEQNASLSPSFPASSLEHTIPRHLVDLKRTYQKFTCLIIGYVQHCFTQRSASNVDDLAVQILVTATALSKEALPPSSVANRGKHQKSLLVQKRKAWSDLLKELKRGGLSASVRPDILRQQSILLWIREQPILPLSTSMKTAIEKAENYYNRFHSSMVQLRALLSSHHPDVSTRDLKRGVMYLESCFNIALDTRSWCVNTLYFRKRRLIPVYSLFQPGS
jgi:midasin